MAQVTREEIKKIAEMTKVYVAEHEIESIMQQFNTVISYAERVVEAASSAQIQLIKNVNVDRADVVIKTDTQPILQQAPDGEENYFVVPKFLDN